MAAVTIALLNMKGGVGKTTLAVNLAWHLCRASAKRVMLVDLDPQFNASQYLMNFAVYDKHRKSSGTIADLLLEPQRNRMALTAKSPKPPSIKSMLHAVEKPLAGGCFDLLASELSLSKAVKNPQGVEYKLEKALKPILGGYDYIVIDCAPTDSVLTATALMASDYVMIPVKPDRFSVLGFGQILEAIEDFREDYPDPHRVTDLGVVFTQVVGDSVIENGCMRDIRKRASHVFNTTLPKSNSYLRAIHEQTPVFDTRFARSITKSAVASLVSEISTRIAALASTRATP